MMCCLMEDYGLLPFYEDLATLRENFFVLSGLIELLLPDLSDHLVRIVCIIFSNQYLRLRMELTHTYMQQSGL